MLASGVSASRTIPANPPFLFACFVGAADVSRALLRLWVPVAARAHLRHQCAAEQWRQRHFPEGEARALEGAVNAGSKATHQTCEAGPGTLQFTSTWVIPENTEVAYGPPTTPVLKT